MKPLKVDAHIFCCSARLRVETEIPVLQERVVEDIRKKGFMFQFETFRVFESSLEEIFSPSAASIIIQSASNRCGRHTCRQILKQIKTKENALTYLSHLKDEMNWGKIFFQDLDLGNGRGRILVYNSFETIARKDTKPSCHFLRGYLAGFLSELFKREITVEEEQCAAMGNSHCKFSLK